MTRLTQKSFELVEAWMTACRYRDRLAKQLEEAEKAEEVCRNQLGCWIAPDDASNGESFQIWVGDALLRVWVSRTTDGPTYNIEWRNGKTPTRST